VNSDRLHLVKFHAFHTFAANATINQLGCMSDKFTAPIYLRKKGLNNHLITMRYLCWRDFCCCKNNFDQLHIKKMNNKLLRALAASFILGISVLPDAQASLVSFSTRFSNAPTYTDAASLRNEVNALMAVAPTTGYCDRFDTHWGSKNQEQCGGTDSNIAFKISALFSVGASEVGTWGFRIGPDFGWGGALFVDGNLLAFSNDDLWWDGDINNAAETLAGSISLTAGNHLIEAFGFEPCCDGAQLGQFLPAGARDFIDFHPKDGHDPITVPEPGTAALLLASLAGLAVRRRR